MCMPLVDEDLDVTLAREALQAALPVALAIIHAMRDHERHGDAARKQRGQATHADIAESKDRRPRHVSSLRADTGLRADSCGFCSTAAIR